MRFPFNLFGSMPAADLLQAERAFRRSIGKNKLAVRRSIKEAREAIERSQRVQIVAAEAVEIIRGTGDEK